MTSRPKRKRADISYFEPDPQTIPDDNEDQDVELEVVAQPAAEDDSEEEPDESDFEDRPKTKAKISVKKQAKLDAERKTKALEKKERKKRKNQKPFRFMELPAELRNVIYGYLLVEDGGLKLIQGRKDRGIVRGHIDRTTSRAYWRRNGTTSRKTYVKKRDKKDGLQVDILRVCRQMHQEATPVLYGQEITLAHPLALFNFLTAIESNNAGLLKNLVVHGWSWWENKFKSMRYPAAVLLRSATNLTRLYFDCQGDKGRSRNSWVYPTNCAQEIFPDIDFWCKAYDHAHGKKGSALEVFSFNRSMFDNIFDSNAEIDLDKSEKQFKDELKRLAGVK